MFRPIGFLVFLLCASAETNLTDFELIPKDQLCSLCHSVIAKFQQENAKNSEQFKNDLLTSCSLLKDEAEIRTCRNGITDEQLKKLTSATVTEICEAQKLCKSGELPLEAQANETDDEQFDAIPDVENPITVVDDPKGFKTFNKAQDMIQNAYA
ncbi:hypothetical protein M3Y95_00866000 [Aphelenchoides besseyi]|nr:hypothetical protein M3Y95_00866000 [Aphelenchoides besseyi]